MLLACITLHQLYYITSSLHHLDALHHLTSEYTNRANPMYYTRCHMYYKGFTFTDAIASADIAGSAEERSHDGGCRDRAAASQCGASRRSSARIAAPTRSISHVSRSHTPSMLRCARRVIGRQWRRGGGRAAGLRGPV